MKVGIATGTLFLVGLYFLYLQFHSTDLFWGALGGSACLAALGVLLRWRWVRWLNFVLATLAWIVVCLLVWEILKSWFASAPFPKLVSALWLLVGFAALCSWCSWVIDDYLAIARRRVPVRRNIPTEQIAEMSAAVLAGNVEVIRALVRSKPDLLDWRDERGKTPLHWAAEAQSFPSIECLVDLGADITAMDKLGYTPEGTARWFGEGKMGYYSKTCRRILAKLNANERGAQLDR